MIGLPFYTFVTVTVTCSLQIILLSNYSLLTISALADTTLLKTTCHFLLLLVGFDNLTYQKDLQLIPYTCGSSVANLIYLSCNGKRCFVVGSILRCLITVTEE